MLVCMNGLTLTEDSLCPGQCHQPVQLQRAACSMSDTMSKLLKALACQRQGSAAQTILTFRFHHSAGQAALTLAF